MKRLIPLTIVLACLLLAGQSERDKDPRQRRMPDGRTQAEHVLEHEYEKSIEDTAEMEKLIKELKTELEKNDYHVLSVKAFRTAERIEKLAKRVKNRLKRF